MGKSQKRSARKPSRFPCPRCNRTPIMRTPADFAISRRDNKTRICSDCGSEEALVDSGFLRDHDSEKREQRLADHIRREDAF